MKMSLNVASVRRKSKYEVHLVTSKMNPFQSISKLNVPLSPETCRAIHFTALERLVKSQCDVIAIPDGFDPVALSDRVRKYGWEVCFFHPNYIAERFDRITTAVYRTIKDLYCERIGRSISMVDLILRVMAAEAQVKQLPYEVVWSICEHLERLREKALQLNVQRLDTTWLVAMFEPDITIIDHKGKQFAPCIACVIDLVQDKVLSFQLAEPLNLVRASRLALYMGLALWRTPESLSPSGLKWVLPKHVLIPPDCMDSSESALMRLGIAVSCGNKHSDHHCSILSRVMGDWGKDLKGRIIPEQQFEAIFDNLLFRWQGHAPRSTVLDRARQYSQLRGFNEEPAALVPALRDLLPAETAIIQDGAVLFDCLNYEHDLLRYWPSAEVTLRRLVHIESCCWIYLGNEVLCEAKARELRRKDGSYRSSRPGR